MRLQQSCRERFRPALEAVRQLQNEQKDSEEPILIAIDGRCGSGKTTLGYYLQEELGGNLFHMDDFFLQNHQRTKARLEEPGGNVDYERFYEEVILPVLQKQDVNYRRFSCVDKSLKEAELISYRRLNFIEGSYSMHPYFKQPYQLRIFTDISKKQQLENIRQRNGEEALQVFQEKWIPMEELYFKTFQIEKDCIRVSWKKV